MFSSTKICLNRTSREFLRELKRQISKTSAATNSDTISSQENKLKLDLSGKNRNVNKWMKISRQNNIR